MENQKEMKPKIKDDLENKIAIQNQYLLKFDSTPFKLTIEINIKDNSLSFRLRQVDNISYYHYVSEYNYGDVIKRLNLEKNDFKDIKNIADLLDTSIKNEKVLINKDEKKNELILNIKLEKDSKEEDCFFNLENKIMSEKEIINILIEEINILKNKDKSNNIGPFVDKNIINKDFFICKGNSAKNGENIDLQNKLINSIIIEIEIDNNQINKPIYFLNIINKSNQKFYEENLKVYINGVKNVKNTYNNFFSPKKSGLYTIILKFNLNLTDCSYMFNINYDYYKNRINLIKSINLSSFKSKNVTTMRNMFAGCKNLLKIIFPSSFDTKSVTDMSQMFQSCENLKEIDLSYFNTKNVTNMGSMFQGCYNLLELNLASFDTKNVENMSHMFAGCENLKKLDLSSFDCEKTKTLNDMFSSCYNLKDIKINKDSDKIKEIIEETFLDLPNINY